MPRARAVPKCPVCDIEFVPHCPSGRGCCKWLKCVSCSLIKRVDWNRCIGDREGGDDVA